MKKVFINAGENYNDVISENVAVAARNTLNKEALEDLKVHSRVPMRITMM
jgi:hypothetical protein